MRLKLGLFVLPGLTVISKNTVVARGRWAPPNPGRSQLHAPQQAGRKPKRSVVHNIIRGGDSTEGKASITASVFNLVNNVAGAGILTLAAGMASGSGWIPAILICAVLGGLSGHSFAIIGDACELTGEKDFKVG